MNLLSETLNDISASGHTVEDVDWVGSVDYGWFTWDEFERLADFDYDASFGSAAIAGDLKVVFTDGNYMKRGEYDGSEWCEYNAPITKPNTRKVPTTVGGNRFMWESLSEMNE